ncbi:MAG: fibronectin type protein [Microbacteriaceae bacterium]|nr:fibronectin type protein [Microbacteriaceae bacterium]
MPRIVAAVAAFVTIGAALVAIPVLAHADSATVVKNYAYTGSTSTFTVPDGITQITITAVGAEGGKGGVDSQGFPAAGGYQGVVSGTMAVTPGQVLTIGVGSGGVTGASQAHSTGGGAGGSNPISGYQGGTGGQPGSAGSSGAGGGGGAATVITTGGTTIVAAGSGGGGGSGQYFPLDGRAPYSTFSARTDAVSTNGQPGLAVNAICTTTCDGGGSGAGGGGVIGGAQGNIEFGTGSYTEWMGYGGYPGQNSTASIDGLGSSYQYYADNNANGSVSITYVTGAPNAPTAVGGSAQDGAVSLGWTAPGATGQGPITDYAIQYAVASSTPSWNSVTDGVSTVTSTVISGLTDGTGYIFRVAAINAVGTSSWSTQSSTITPSGPPSAPTSLVATPGDGQLSIAFTVAASGSAVTDYQYQVGSGSWVSAGTALSPVVVPGLTNGVSYAIGLRAISAIGTGAASSSVTRVPQSVPGAPSITSTSADGGVASVVFTPGFSGGGTILDYQYQLDGTGSWISAATTASPVAISGLASGSSHTVSLRARNAAGTGAASQSSAITMPGTPSAPAVSSVTVGDQSLTIAFTPGATGGSPVTNYQYQLTTNGPWFNATGLSSPITVTGLANGTTLQVSLRANNSVGLGVASAPVTATPATTPGAPTIVGNTVAGSDASLSAAFTAPDSTGGSPIIGYEYSTDAGATWLPRATGTTDSPLVITALSSDGTTPLTNGTEYYVEVRAVNAIGSGTASAVASGIARTVPSAPAISSLVASNGSLSVTFQPGANGGAAITSYEYRLGTGSWSDTGSLGTTFSIGGLTNGTAYDVQLRAVNSVGNGSAATAVSGTPVTLPGQPTIQSVVRGDRSLTVAVALASTGGSAVTRWEYSTDNGATWAAATGTTSPLVITSLSSNTSSPLVNSTAYAVQVRAVTAVGTGVASATNTAAPSTTPVAPVVSVTPLNQSARVAFTLSGDGGSPISGIDYSIDGGQTWQGAGSLSSPFTITGLSNGTAYPIQVRADNVIGAGSASTTTSTTPRTVPDAPTAVAAVADTASADVAWSAPGSNGGSPVTGYVASAYAASTGGSAIATCTTTTAVACAIPSLANGTTYYVSVVAQNAAGSGVESSPRTIVTPLARPSAPTIGSVTTGNAFLTVNFTAGAQGSSAITGYQYQLNGGSWVSTTATSSPITLSGLTNGTAYSVVLRAASSAGIGASSAPMTGTPYSTPDTIDSNAVFADGQNGSIVVTWPAANPEGSAITEYDAVAWSAQSMGSQVRTCSITGSPVTLASTYSCTLPSMSNGTTYWVTIQSTNGGGASIRSTRIPVTPNVTTGAVGTPVAVAGNGQASLSWAQGSTGGSAITDYQVWYSANGGSYTQFSHTASTALSQTVTGLTNGVPYTFMVYAVNGSGAGAASTASNSITPKAPGVTPTTSTVAPGVHGFTFTIANYDSSLSYLLTAPSGVTATRASGTGNVTVSGLAAGASATIGIAASSSAVAMVSANVTSNALADGIAPALSTATRGADGFSFTVTNPSTGTTYTATTDHGTATVSGSSITVTGLGLGGTASVTVTAHLAGSTDASTPLASQALSAGTAPTFGTVTRTAHGFTVPITNYSSSLTYTFGATGGAIASQADGTVTVTGLAPGASTDLTVTATLPAQTTASAIVTAAALATGTTPAAGIVTGAANSFSFAIVNFDGSTGYTVTADHGTVSQSNGTVTVTGLNPGQGATVHIVAAAAGFTTTTLDVNSSALWAGHAPTFDSVTPTVDGYLFSIANYDSDVTYAFSAPTGVTVSPTGATVTVSGLAAAASADVVVTATRSWFTDAQATVSGSALGSGVAPAFSSVTRTAHGFTFTVTNYNPALSYSATGATVQFTAGSYVVTGLAPAASATIVVTAVDPGVSTASASIGGSALDAGVTPTLSATASGAGGFTFTIDNLSSDYSYSFATTNGGSATLTAGTVTVTGLAAASSAITTVTASRDGYAPTSATATGTTFGGGTVPSVSGLTRADDGFTFTIANYDPAYAYAVSASTGSVVRTGAVVVVTGLTAGQQSTIRVSTSETGEVSQFADIVGSAISAGVPATFGIPSATTNGFTVQITDYDPAFAYAFAATNGANVSANGALVTVDGLAAGGASTVTVSATRAGYQDASARVSGSAAPVAARAPVVTPTVAPTAPSTNQAPAVSELEPGVITVIVDGVPVKFVVTQDSKGLTLTGNGLVLKLELKSNVSGGSVTQGVITLQAGSLLHLTVAGFTADSQVGVWTFSTPTFLTSATVASDHSASEDFSLPAGIPVGKHTLFVKGTSAAGAPVSVSLGYLIAKPVVKKSLAGLGRPDDGSTFAAALAVWIGGVVVAAIIAAMLFFVLGRRRRRDDEDEEFERSWQLP